MTRFKTLLAVASLIFFSSTAAMAQQAASVKVLSAGSLREAFNDMRVAYEKITDVKVALSYGPSGKLRAEIESGRAMDVFASASINHTEKLVSLELLDESKVFAYNDLCVVHRAGLHLTEQNLLAILAEPRTRLATSTPVSDPMGDYTWQFFRNAEKLRPGLFQAFDEKAIKLSGATAPAPGEKLPYVTAFEDNKTDAYIMYCTNAVSTKAAVPSVAIMRIPDSLNVRSKYGIGAHPKSEEGKRFVRFVLSAEGRSILQRYGFN